MVLGVMHPDQTTLGIKVLAAIIVASTFIHKRKGSI